MIGELARQHGVLAGADTISAAFDYALNHPDRIRIAVAVDADKQVLGTASLHEHYSTWNASHLGSIEDFFVLPEHRSTGIGTEIMKLLTEEAKRRGYCRVELQVQEDNDRAWKFYERRGLNFTGYLVYAQDLVEEKSESAEA
jgi:ribosomal protein S18 acetylase RimI-like enzyme